MASLTASPTWQAARARGSRSPAVHAGARRARTGPVGIVISSFTPREGTPSEYRAGARGVSALGHRCWSREPRALLPRRQRPAPRLPLRPLLALEQVGALLHACPPCVRDGEAPALVGRRTGVAPVLGQRVEVEVE